MDQNEKKDKILKPAMFKLNCAFAKVESKSEAARFSCVIFRSTHAHQRRGLYLNRIPPGREGGSSVYPGGKTMRGVEAL